MAQVKLLKIDTDGVSVEFNSSADDITLNSFTAGAGPVMSPTGIDMNNTDLSDVSDIDFNDPAVSTIEQTAGALIINNIMAKERNNVMTTAGAVLFPSVGDVAGELDSFKVPHSSALPTATPAFSSDQGYLAAYNGSLYMWDGAAWNDLGVADSTNAVTNVYTAGAGGIAARDVVYISAADTVLKASAAAGGAPSRAMGLAVAAITAAAQGDIQSEGVLAGFSGLTAGSRYYLDASTPGLITATKPTGAGNTVVQIGYAKSATEFHIHIEQLGRVAA